MTEEATSKAGREPATRETTESKLLVVDLGKKQTKKRIRSLRKGRGKLVDRVQDLIAGLREQGAMDENAQPIVVVVREKARLPYGKKGLRFRTMF